MRTKSPAASRGCFVNFPIRFSVFVLLISSAFSSFAAELSVEFEVVARSNSTPVPDSGETFLGFGEAPAIDDDGNVVFIGGGFSIGGVYTSIGVCCQKVADTNTVVPGGGNATFGNFYGSELPDIDGGRVAFKALNQNYLMGLYSNAGQSGPDDLMEIAVIDGTDWVEGGGPWVDGSTVAMYGKRPQFSQPPYDILEWEGVSHSTGFVDPGQGYTLAYNTQASISNNAAILARYKTGSYQMGISSGSGFEVLATADQTAMPGLGGVTFSTFYDYPVIDRGGQDALFLGAGGQFQGLFKRVNSGPLTNVADTTTQVPGSTGEVFGMIPESGISLANGNAVFYGAGQYFLRGIYTDIGGELTVLLDNEGNNTIMLDGQPEQVTSFSLSTRSFAYTPQGYMIVFRAYLASGGSAVIRATVNEDQSQVTDSFTVHKVFTDNNASGVRIDLSCTSGTVTNNPQYASSAAPAVFTISDASPGTTCSAIESVPAGYSANQADCENGDPINGSCTIVNTPVPSSNTFSVYKDFTDNHSGSVSVTLSCSSGSVTNNPQLASEASPAVFNISGASPGATCTAVESVPAGYTANQTDCQNGDPLDGNCTLVNTPVPSSNTFTVYKNFTDNSTGSVNVTLSCTSGSVTNNPQLASEASPAVFNISGASPGATCTAVESVPAGYTANQTDCQNGDPLNGNCTIVNTPIPSSNSFTVYKDFSDNSSASVSINLSCTSGTVTNNPQPASESSPAVFNISGASAGATCTAVESVPVGYTADQSDCQNGDPVNGSCTIVNTLVQSSDSFWVFKDFTDDNPASVSVTLSCTSGTVTNNPQMVSEAAKAKFTIVGASPGTTCSATENPVPPGYTADEKRCQNGDPLNGACLIINTPVASELNTFTVFKDFSDNSNASVSISLSCSDGTVTNNPQPASESSPAVFSISGASAGATCTAVESVPAGYTADQSDCQNGDPLDGNCTIVNTAIPSSHSFTVYKDFSDNSNASVSISLSCSDGTVTNNPQPASESSPAVFSISGASAGATCTAVESVPAGYTADQSDCQNGDPLDGDCTIVNTAIPSSHSFTVYKDFSDNSSASVSISLSCSDGTVTNNPQPASESSPAVFSISGASAGATCTAVESVPAGYTADQSDCQNGDPLDGNCTIVNTAIPSSHSFTVYKDFSDNSNASVSISLSCSDGTVTNNPQPASESSPAVFSISGASAGATCTAVESVPAGYTADQSDCQNGDPLDGDCTIVNTAIPSSHSFTVYKDFSDNSSASVSISLSCSDGTVTNNPQPASESSPAVFSISGASAGATCTAVESVPAGYTADQSDCEDDDPLDGSCTIVNTLVTTSEQDVIIEDFEDGNASGWSFNGNVSVDGILAIGQYSLRHAKGSESAMSLSTVGFEGVSIEMNLAASSLKKNDSCVAEVSTNGGDSWTTVVELQSNRSNGSFYYDTISPQGASDNSDLQLRFRATGKGRNGGYCYGDEIVVRGTPN